MTIEPTPAPPTPPPPVFRWLQFIGGLLVALVGGGFLSIFAGFFGMLSGVKPLAFVITAIPGMGIVIVSLIVYHRESKNGFAQGLLIGGCVIGLLGGICGMTTVGTSIR